MADTKATKKTSDAKTTTKKADAKPVWHKSTHGECPYPEQYDVVD